jgi:uncharacterized protein (TIGR00730 family)
MRVCVFAGSKPGRREEYRQAAHDLGQALVTGGHTLIYGGARGGLMGAVAESVLSGGGVVIGVVPRTVWSPEENHDGLTQLVEVNSMHERKARMFELADGFIALPGGFGTLDELFEVMTYAILGLHSKPIGVLNIAGYFAPFLALLAQMIEEGFVQPGAKQLIVHATTTEELLDQLMLSQSDKTAKEISLLRECSCLTCLE